MRVVVTGATSFIGAVTVRQLLQHGHRVWAIVRPGSTNLRHLQNSIPSDVAHQLDISHLDLEQIAQLKTMGHADAWIHIGWDGAGSENRMKQKVQQQNVEYSLEAVRTAAAIGCTRFLFTGSQAEYGVCHTQITEATVCNPVSEYGKAKVEFANRAKDLCKSLKMEYIHTRIFSVYGPGDHPWSLVNTCLNTWMQGGYMELGECTQSWNFLYIEDAAAALLELLDKGKPGIYNLAGEDTRILREFIEEMYELCGRNGSYTYGTRSPNAEGPASLIPDISRLKADTGWYAHVSFMEGIYETMHSLQEEAS